MKPQEALHEISTMVFRNTDNFEMRISKDCYKNIVNALEKQIPQKPVFDKDGCLVCGNCGSYDGIRTETNFIEGYCWECGQKIDTDHPTEKGGDQ